ncbi:MAG: acyl-CoA dehydrogenase [Planctomycetota bacterium]
MNDPKTPEGFLRELRARAHACAESFGNSHDHGEGEAAMRAALAALARANLVGFAVAPSRGGCHHGGLCGDDRPSVRAMSALRDELAYGDGLLDLAFVMQGLGSYPLQLGGRGAWAHAKLRQVASGDAIAAYGLTEPGAGSSLDEIATRAERDGDAWVLDGHKTFISNAGVADFYCVLARTQGDPGDRAPDQLTMFYVPKDSPGLRAEPFDVIAPHPIGDVFLEGVRVDDDARLGEVGGGLDLALATLARFRTLSVRRPTGFVHATPPPRVGRLSRRHQFGKPLGANQGLRFDLAEMDARLRAAQLLVDEAARLSDADDAGAARAVARAKLVATGRHGGWICDRAVQHHGGLGVKRGQIVEELFREVRALRIYEGASEIQRLILGKLVLSEGAQPPR